MPYTVHPGVPCSNSLVTSDMLLYVQALFRPVSMAVPDLALICEIMLMAEGFQQSKLLSRKFIILYKLCEDLLSKVLDCNFGTAVAAQCARPNITDQASMCPPPCSHAIMTGSCVQ